MAARWVAVALTLLGGCSLRSLDYLEAGVVASGGRGGTAPSEGGKTSGGSATTDGGDPSGQSGEPSTGASNAGGSVGSGGTGTAGAAGSAGAAPEIPDCTDSRVTADETDVDCGGRTCAPCAADQRCVTGTDCDSGICTNQVCQAPTCTDLAVNGDETDKNCGGSCPGCAQGMHCKRDDDCANGKCEDGVCVSATCVDGVLTNGCPLLVDNTPYSFAPSHAPTRCLDDGYLSVANGASMIMWSCRTELQQTFWAVDQKDGYFALRSALSGKCLQVRGASTVDGAVIEQSTCNYGPAQLWMPSRYDSSLMQLKSKLSGFFMDVAGDEVSSDGQLIVQSEEDGSADTRWRAVKRTAAAYVSFSPLAERTTRIQHTSSVAELGTESDTDTHWKVVPGLADPAMVSFQSRDEPGRYLRHASFRLWSDTSDGSTQFMRDATFRFANPFQGTDAHTKAFESTNYPGRFWAKDGSKVLLKVFEDRDAFKSAATWWLEGR
jgi:Alpha-L-arabinofuranosidase B (ABFB) domain